MYLPKILVFFGLFVLVLNVVRGSEDDDFAEFDDEFEEDERSSSFNKNKQPSTAKPQQNEKEPVDDDDDFQEIHEEEEEEKPVDKAKKRGTEEDMDDGLVEDEDDFEGLDEDEFEDGDNRREMPPPKLTITEMQMPLRGWQAYWAELIMLSGILIYLANYILGRYKNQRLAQLFFDVNWGLLEENFALIGDTTKLEEDLGGSKNFTKMSDSLYQLWCSGRVCCEGMLVELKLLKRQDIISLLNNVFRPQRDVVRLSIEMSHEEMDPIVFYFGQKKAALKYAKEYNDLVNYCSDKRPLDKFGLTSSNNFFLYSELSEVLSGVLDQRTVSVINKYSANIESIHITDQWTGLKSQEPEVNKEGIMKLPDPKCFIFFTFLLNTNSTGANAEDCMEQIKPLITFAIQTIDRIRRYKISKEGKAKADKNRAKVEELFLKQTHAARAEAAASRREEKRRMEKERILQEEDPDKQRRWEVAEAKREKKRKQPKIKQLKVKAM